MKSLYCHDCQNYLMGADGECHDCVCGWKQPIDNTCDCHTNEVSQSPDAYLHSWRNGCRQKLSKSPTWTKIYHDDQDQPDDLIVSALYLLPPDAEALRKENEQLREQINDLESLMQEAAQGLRFRSQSTNGDPILSKIWKYMVKLHPEYDGRMSGWASMRKDWLTTSGAHCFGCSCPECKNGAA